MLAAITVYDLITIQRFLNVIWVKNANLSCDIEFDVGSNESFYATAWVFYNLGLLNGSMFASKYVNERWWDTVWWKSGIRMGIAVGVTVGFRFMFRKEIGRRRPCVGYHDTVLFLLRPEHTLMANFVECFPIFAQRLNLILTTAAESTAMIDSFLLGERLVTSVLIMGRP
jgi:hypothetical protein